jgi:ubiquinone/menaquinone biosynthesis C-methylase UbiE
VKPDPSLDEYRQKWNSLYERSNYDRGLAAYFMRRSHDWCERRFDAASHFGRVLEIGAGSGAHLRAVRHRWDEYWLTDSNPALLAQIAPGIAPPGGKVIVRREDATRLSFPDRCFDRLIATHVLEHLPEPHRVLREWARVVRPGGIISVVLPCDPGLAWRWGRHLGPRRTFIRAGIDYDYWMAREHINPIGNLVRFLRHYFDEIDECWRPCLLPSIDLNLFYVAHVRVDGDAR